LLWRKGEKGDHFPTAADFLLFGVRPGDRFPQCEILVDAYSDTKISGKPRGQSNINAALPKPIDQVLEFVDKHTFHPTRVVGINNTRYISRYTSATNDDRPTNTGYFWSRTRYNPHQQRAKSRFKTRNAASMGYCNVNNKPGMRDET